MGRFPLACSRRAADSHNGMLFMQRSRPFLCREQGGSEGGGQPWVGWERGWAQQQVVMDVPQTATAECCSCSAAGHCYQECRGGGGQWCARANGYCERMFMQRSRPFLSREGKGVKKCSADSHSGILFMQRSRLVLCREGQVQGVGWGRRVSNGAHTASHTPVHLQQHTLTHTPVHQSRKLKPTPSPTLVPLETHNLTYTIQAHPASHTSVHNARRLQPTPGLMLHRHISSTPYNPHTCTPSDTYPDPHTCTPCAPPRCCRCAPPAAPA